MRRQQIVDPLTPHLIFIEDLDAQAVKYIQKLAAAGEQVRCYTKEGAATEKYTRHLSLPNIKLHVFGKEEQVYSAGHNAYAVGRKITRAMSEALEDFQPDFFKISGLPYNFNALYQFSIQFEFARHRLNFILNSLHVITNESSTSKPRITFLNHPYLFAPSWQALIRIFPELDRPECAWHQTRPLPLSSIQLKVQCSLTEWRYQAKRLFKRPASASVLPTNSVIAYSRLDHHLRVIEPTLKLMALETPIIFLDYFPSKFKAEQPEFLAKYQVFEQGQFLVTNPRQFYPSPEFMAQIHAHLAVLADRILKADASKEMKLFYWQQLLKLKLFFKQVLRLEGIIKTLRPKLVTGCMEADAFGLIFQELKKQYPFRHINHLHGIAPHFDAMDFCHYDAFFIWNRMTEDVILDDGYPDDGSLKIVGNPFWEASGNLDTVSSSSETVQDILQWKGNEPLIIAYTQTETNYTTLHQRTEYLSVLIQFLQGHPGIKLLVKKHPNEFDDLAERMLREAGLSERTRVYKMRELPLYDSFRVGDLLTSICSTVLLEGLYYHLPVVAIDFEQVNATLGNGLDKVVPLISRREEVVPVLKELLQAGINHPAFDAEKRAWIYPAFINHYSERVAEELRQLGLLSSSSQPNPSREVIGASKS